MVACEPRVKGQAAIGFRGSGRDILFYFTFCPGSLYGCPMRRAVRIYCPHCVWKPHPADRWYCACSYAWNTFETAGLCPGCGSAWKVTQCLSCSAISPHRDWYHETAGSSEREGKEQVEHVRMESNDLPESCRQSVPPAENPVRMMPGLLPKHSRVQCELSPLAPN